MSSFSWAKTGAAASLSSSSNSTERPAKLLTKFSGFLISWAMPALTEIGRLSVCWVSSAKNPD
jgi:hypothetical protein